MAFVDAPDSSSALLQNIMGVMAQGNNEENIMEPINSSFQGRDLPTCEENPVSITDIPLDVIYAVFLYLGKLDLSRASAVCTAWNSLVKSSVQLKRQIFADFPEPLREYLAREENYGKIPSLKIEGTKGSMTNDRRAFLCISPGEGRELGSFPFSTEMMSSPMMFLQEPWKRIAIAIKYHVILPKGIEKDFSVVLHEVGSHQPGIWGSNIPLYNRGGINIGEVVLSNLFENNWQTNEFGECDYLRKLLNSEPCGRIEWNMRNNVSSHSVIEPATFKNALGEDIPYVRICEK